MRDRQFIQILINGHLEAIRDIYSALSVLELNGDYRFSIQVLQTNLEERKQLIKSLKEELKFH